MYTKFWVSLTVISFDLRVSPGFPENEADYAAMKRTILGNCEGLGSLTTLGVGVIS
jgi:hypothetical protein